MMVELFFLKSLEKYDGFPKIIKAYALPLHKQPSFMMPCFVIEMTNVGKPLKYTGNITEARHTLGEICKLLHILHKNDIVHCDIKLQNILIDDNGKISIIDFGHSHKLNPFTHMLGKSLLIEQTPTGTAPESLPYSILPRTEQIDIWSLGCLYYELLTDIKLFYSSSDNTYINEIRRSGCSDFDRELLEMMLVVDPIKRANVEQILDKLNVIPENVAQLWAKPDDVIIRELSLDMIPIWFEMDKTTQTVGYYIIKCLEMKMIEKIRPIRYSFHELVYMLVLKLFEPRSMHDSNDFCGCRLTAFDDKPDVIFNLYVSMLDDILSCFPNNSQFDGRRTSTLEEINTKIDDII
jgi:serine/threonine protein kinase